MLGQAQAVAREVADVGRLAQVHGQVHQVVEPVRAEDGQVCEAQRVPQRQAPRQRVPVDNRLRSRALERLAAAEKDGHSRLG